MRAVVSVHVFALALLVLVAGCGQDEKTLQSLSVKAVEPTMPVGLSQPFTAFARFTDGSESDVTAEATWASSDTSVLRLIVTNGAQGVAAAVKAGNATISATYAGMTARAAVDVTPAQLHSITVEPSRVTAALQTQTQFTALGIFTDGSKRDITNEASWSTSSPSVATISNDPGSKGLAVAHAAGFTTVRVIFSGKTGTAGLTVSPALLNSVQVTTGVTSIPMGVQGSFNATGLFSDGTNQDLTQTVQWSTTDSRIAVVSKGTLTPMSPGVVTVRASALGVTGSVQVTITPANLTQVLVQPNGSTVITGTTRQFRAFGLYSDSTRQDITMQATWATDDSNIATISSTGLVRGESVGRAKVMVSLGSGYASTYVHVADATLTSVEVTPTSVSLPAGLVKQFKASGTYSNGMTRDVTNEVTWTSSDPALIAVSNGNDRSGLATSVAGAGSVTLAATLDGQSASATFTATGATLEAVLITPSVPRIAKGTELGMIAYGRFTDRRTYEISPLVTWSSTNEAVATVSNVDGTRGVVRAEDPGQSTIAATWGGVTGNTTVTVTSAVLSSLDISPKEQTIQAGHTVTFRAIGTYSDGSKQDVSTQVIWTTSDSSIANISNDPATIGQLTAVTPGAATIIGSLSGKQSSTTLTVTAP